MITLVIIGVIAAITVPTLITKYQKEQTVTRLKKAYSTLAQVYSKAQTDNGTNFKIDYETDADKPIVFKNFVEKYFNNARYCGNTGKSDCFTDVIYQMNGSVLYNLKTSTSQKQCTFSLADGSCILGWIGGDRKHILFYIDINCKKKPNKLGRDIFQIIMFLEKDETNQYTQLGVKFPKRISDSTMNMNMSREELLSSNYNDGCNKLKRGINCGALIQLDSWQIKDDYPW